MKAYEKAFERLRKAKMPDWERLFGLVRESVEDIDSDSVVELASHFGVTVVDTEKPKLRVIRGGKAD